MSACLSYTIHPDKAARGFIFFLFFCGYNEKNGIYAESHKVEYTCKHVCSKTMIATK